MIKETEGTPKEHAEALLSKLPKSACIETVDGMLTFFKQCHDAADDNPSPENPFPKEYWKKRIDHHEMVKEEINNLSN